MNHVVKMSNGVYRLESQGLVEIKYVGTKSLLLCGSLDKTNRIF